MGLDMYLYAERNAPTLPFKKLPNDSDYISGWPFSKPSEKTRYRQLLKAVSLSSFVDAESPHVLVSLATDDRPATVRACVGYWRKANAIHQWFIEQVQGGVDECQLAAVSRDQLDELRARCHAVVASTALVAAPVINGYRVGVGGTQTPIIEPGQACNNTLDAQALLPTKGGFFFGSTDYDEYYLDDVKHTITIIDRVLQAPTDTRFFYRSSW